MDGKSHAIVGGVVGGLVSLGVGNDLLSMDTGTLVAVGSVAGLVPDLDTNGKLSGKITISHKIIQNLSVLIGILVIIYSFFKGIGYEKYIGIGIGLGIVILTRYITQRRMLLMTGVGMVLLGVTMSMLWVILLGLYVGAASLMGHRTYTHTVWGLVYFGYVAYLMSMDFSHIEGLFLTMVLGYVSHLVCDFKVFNKRGVKLFRPFINIEF